MSDVDYPRWAVSEEQKELFATAMGFDCPNVLLQKESTTKKFVDAKYINKGKLINFIQYLFPLQLFLMLIHISFSHLKRVVFGLIHP
jgi:hypothetical protein